jgi:hypothetical protein
MPASPLGDATVVLDMEQGRYYGLNATGAWLWDLLAEPMLIRDLYGKLAAEFAVPQPQCEQDVMTYVQELLARGLVQVVAAAEA